MGSSIGADLVIKISGQILNVIENNLTAACNSSREEPPVVTPLAQLQRLGMAQRFLGIRLRNDHSEVSKFSFCPGASLRIFLILSRRCRNYSALLENVRNLLGKRVEASNLNYII